MGQVLGRLLMDFYNVMCKTSYGDVCHFSTTSLPNAMRVAKGKIKWLCEVLLPYPFDEGKIQDLNEDGMFFMYQDKGLTIEVKVQVESQEGDMS